MQIIKKSGKKEDFSIEKIKSSLNGASRDAGIVISDGDMRRILSELQQMVKDKELITSQHINVIISGLLYTNGYHNILEYYANFDGKKS